MLTLQVDVVLPLDPEEAFPDNEEAQELWDDYVEAQCPRLSAGKTVVSCLEQLSTVG